MSALKDRRFWLDYAKFLLVIVAGLCIATFLLGVPADVTVRLGAGALIAFPIVLGLAHKRRPDRQPVN